MESFMSNKVKINYNGYNPDITSVVEWDGFKYNTDCPSFHYSIHCGSQQPYWQGRVPRDSELNIIKSYLEKTKRNSTFLDVGGHIGTMAIPLSKMYNQVHTFEPNSKNYNFLVGNIESNNIQNIKSYNMAIADCQSKVNSKRHADANSGCYQIVIDDRGSVKCDTLDSLDFKDVDFIKIDVQGLEIKVLQGAINTIRKYKPFLMIEAGDEKTDCTPSKKSIIECLNEEKCDYNMYHDNGADIFLCSESSTQHGFYR
tara:strand:- start:5369 stop:6136 length:768 start_codon:yes stop_codon:yes gene_type:complete